MTIVTSLSGVVDRFGVPWMVNTMPAAGSQ